jgi:hypothetical protein
MDEKHIILLSMDKKTHNWHLSGGFTPKEKSGYAS